MRGPCHAPRTAAHSNSIPPVSLWSYALPYGVMSHTPTQLLYTCSSEGVRCTAREQPRLVRVRVRVRGRAKGKVKGKVKG
jgi:hypothetical protein